MQAASDKSSLFSLVGVRYEVEVGVLDGLSAHFWRLRDELNPHDADAIEAVIPHYGVHTRRLKYFPEMPDPFAERVAHFPLRQTSCRPDRIGTQGR